MADENIVTAPPVTKTMTDSLGRPTKEWAIWFRDMYRRTSYKGGNAIDDANNDLDDTIDTLDEAIEQILINVDNIETNTTNIATNTVNIAQNTQDTIDLEFRVVGQTPPPVYQTEGKDYERGELVSHPDVTQRNYYTAINALTDPAGPFDQNNWIEVSLRNSVPLELFRKMAPAKACHLSFMGRADDGLVVPNYGFNVSTITRNGVGTYDVIMAQSTFYGIPILPTGNPFASYSFTPNLDTEAFHIEVKITSDFEFTILVYEWVIGSGNKIEISLYDPVTTTPEDDEVFVTVLSDISDGLLPPP